MTRCFGISNDLVVFTASSRFQLFYKYNHSTQPLCSDRITSLPSSKKQTNEIEISIRYLLYAMIAIVMVNHYRQDLVEYVAAGIGLLALAIEYGVRFYNKKSKGKPVQ
ncbi:MAG: hypothetical protein KGJ02_08015 [Verrucomicrobiota bacterium]|nr:hypothetical protein [Verrucomicrobiota bacterium]